MSNVEMIVRVPGLFDADTTFVIEHKGFTAIAHPKSIVITNGDTAEWMMQDDVYLVSNVNGEDVDELVELVTPEVNNQFVELIQLTCQAILLAGNPGPVCEKWLTKVVEDDKLAFRATKKAQRKAERAAA